MNLVLKKASLTGTVAYSHQAMILVWPKLRLHHSENCLILFLRKELIMAMRADLLRLFVTYGATSNTSQPGVLHTTGTVL